MSIDGATTEGQFIQTLTTFNVWACQTSVITQHVLPTRIISWHSIKGVLSGYNKKCYIQGGEPNLEYQAKH